MKQTIHIIAGPTASGKSAKALERAKELDGVIINADSVQIYNALPILTASPSAKELEQAPHELYAVRHPNDPCSAGNWVQDAQPIIEKTLAEGRTPIVVGGTGLYIKALTQGLSPMPDIPPDIRAQVVEKYETLGAEAFYAELKKRDPVMAARFHLNHKARIIRAMEVLEATGKSLAEWQKIPPQGPPKNWHFEIHKIMPERAELYKRCNARFDQMLENGALEEASDFGKKIESGEYAHKTPITKALGLSQLLNYLNLIENNEHDEEKLDEIFRKAIIDAKTATRRYAKRQVTWFRNQI